MKSNRFLWGVFFLLLGSMWLGIELNYISSVSWFRLVQLWPTLVVLAGLGIILKNGKLYTAIGVAAIIFAFAYAAYSPVTIANYFGVQSKQSQKSSVISRSESDKRLVIELDAGAAEINITALGDDKSKDTAMTVEAEGIDSLKTEKSTVDGVVTVKINEMFEGGAVLENSKRILNIKITRDLPVEVIYSAGATKARMDFTEVDLVSLTSKSGATSAEIRLGNKEPLVSLVIQSGVSDYTVYVPKETGYRVISKSGLSNITYPGEKATAVGDDTKESVGYGTDKNKLNLTIESGLTNLRLIKY